MRSQYDIRIFLFFVSVALLFSQQERLLVVATITTATGTNTSPQLECRVDNAPHMARCCGERSTAEELWRCVLRETKAFSQEIMSAPDGKHPELVVVSYVTSNIAGYAAYALATTAAWAELRGYPLKIYTEHDTDDIDLDEYDPRWNKVSVAKHAMTHWAPKTQSVLWVDADLAALDFTTTLQDFLSPNPYDPVLYICAETMGSTTYTNSGSFLVKNNAKGLELLNLWWTVVDRNLHSDQQALDVILSSHDSWIHVLPANFFNTYPPAMTDFRETDRAVHLMGSTTRYRAKIFSSTFDEVCSAHEESRPVRHQLGLTRELLLESAIEIHGKEYDEFMIILRNTDIYDFDEKVLFDMERSAKALEHALRHSDNKQAAQKLMDDVYGELVSTCRRLRRRKLPLSLSLIERKVQVMMSYIQKLEGSSLEHLLDIYEEGKEDLQFLIKAVSLGQKGTIITYQASIEESLGMAYIARKMFGEAIEAHLKAVELLESHEAIQPHVRLKPLGILAGLLCQVNRHSEAMPHFEKVIKMETKRLGKNHQSLGNHYLNRGICNFMAGNSSIARRDLLEAKRVYTANGMPHNSMELQRVRDFLHKIKVTGLSDEF